MRKDGPSWIVGWLETPAGKVPRVSPKLTAWDILGSWRMRWRIRRGSYRVEPGLYAIGSPGPDSPVLVSANYKMSFDVLRRAVAGRDTWILVVDTKGINVWCAAGKGTFSTAEVLRRTESTGLRRIVPHGVLVLPQLSATGVSSHELQKLSGFPAVFGPVRAKDIPAFLDNGLKTTPEMRRVKFGITDRLVLTPAEFVWSLKYLVVLLAIIFILGGINWLGFSLDRAWYMEASVGLGVLGAVLAGNVVTPLVLPWVPGRAFSWKGCQVGLVWALAFAAYPWHFWGAGAPLSVVERGAALLVLPAISAYFALNFTGCSTYTSMSGVRKEIGLALPPIKISAIMGAGIFVAGLIVGLFSNLSP